MSKYQLQPGGVLDTENGALIPQDEGNRHWQEYLAWVVEGNVADPWKTEAELLSEAKDAAIRRIDELAEKERQKYITPGAGQAMTYIRKEQEARAILQDSAVNPVSYPILAASVAAELSIKMEEVSTSQMQSMAESVVFLSDQWAIIAAHIEEVRLGAKRQVLACLEVDPIASIINNLNWSLE